MYSILVVSDDEQLNKKLNSLKSSDLGFEIKKILRDSKSAYEELKNESYDLVVARASLITDLRAGDDFSETDSDIETRCAERLTEFFLSRGGELKEYLATLKNDISARVLDAARVENLMRAIYITTINNVFAENEWLELYLKHEDFTGQGSADLRERLLSLAKDYAKLFPIVNSDKTEEVILYILNNPESDLRQKTIASKMYVNSSYLSTVFAAQTGERFVDYLTSVKLRRAAYLLMNSPLRISEIAARLDYKDIGYFSRLFRNHYGIPPSEYRIPDNYTYEI